ncbi:MAG: hypothetical protein JWN00_3177 [Actinomycetia bacterium]|nr:hypothetical protein [Actinomycetes bacterium]
MVGQALIPVESRLDIVSEEPVSSRFRPLVIGSVLIPGATGFGLSFWQIDRVSIWRDEAATISAAHRPLGRLLTMLGHIDTVHGAYYLLMHVMITLFGASETVVRLPSAAGAGLAAGGLVVLGTRLAGRRAGVMAGLLYAVTPMAVRYGQEGRSYSLVASLAVVSMIAFVRLAETGGRRRIAGYALTVAALGILQFISLFLVLAHGAIIPALRRQRRRLLIGWLTAGAVSCLALIPLLAVAVPAQSGQNRWITPPDWSAVQGFLSEFAGSPLLVWVYGALAVAALFTARSPGPVPAVPVALAWLAVPAATMIAVSFLFPIFNPRYVLFCLPALALLAALGLERLPWRSGLVALPGLMAMSLQAQIPFRTAPAFEDMRAEAAILRTQARDGDAVVYLTTFNRLVPAAYPKPFRRLWDIAYDDSPRMRAAQAADLYGLTVDDTELGRRLTRVWRVWSIRPSYAPGSRFYGVGRAPREFCDVRDWSVPGMALTLYERCPH